MIRNATILGLLIVLSGTSSVWAQRSLVSQDPLPSSRNLNRYGLEMGWWSQATIEGQRDKVLHVAVDERNLFVLTTAGLLTSIDAETGQKQWTSRVGRRDQTGYLPVANDRLVMVAIGLKLIAIDRLTGRTMWEIDLPKVPSSGPAADDDQLYIGSLDGSVYAFDLRRIQRLYGERLLPAYSESTQVWRYQTGGKITSPPISTGRSVVFASRDRSLYSVAARSRRLLFQFETDAPISAPLVKNENNVFLASEDFNFYCLNANNGQVRWSFLSGFPIRKPPRIIEGEVDGSREKVVYVLPELGGISALRASTGREIWPRAQLEAVDFLACTNRILFTTDQIGNVLLLNRQNGRVMGNIPAVTYSHHVANDRTDRLFLARPDGLLVMIREQGSTFPVYHQFPDRRPILPELFDPATTPLPGDNDDDNDNNNDDNN